MTGRVKRIRQELAVATQQYSTSRHADMDELEGQWVRVLDFPLPPGFNFTSTDILFMLPPGYPETPPDWFYLNPYLKLQSGKPLHFFDHDDPRHHPDKRPHLDGWAGGCIHIEGDWHATDNPMTGHSLLTLCEIVKRTFARWTSESG